MTISVVIASNNRSGLLHRTLGCLVQQDYQERLEVLLVLDGVKRPELPLRFDSIPTFEFRVIEQPKSGQAAAINRGIKAATGEVILFLDDDVAFGPDLVRRHAAAHQEGATELVFGPVLTSEDSADNVVTEKMRRTCDLWFEKLKPEDSSTGWFLSFANPNTSARRDVIVASGGLDESFGACNDTEVGVRLWKQGLRWRFLPDANVRHVYRKSPRAFAKQEARERGRGEIQLCRKHVEYRQFCGLAELNRGRTWQRILKRFAVVRIPAGADAVLSSLSFVMRPFASLKRGKDVAVRLLTWRYLLNFYRGAIEAAGSWDAFHRDYCMMLPVLLYHRVGTPEAGEWPGLSVRESEFKCHMHWLKNSEWQAITVELWKDWLDAGTPLPDKPFLLTFDDGYKENVESAYPVLQELGFPSTTFLITARLGTTSNWDDGRPAQQLVDRADVERLCGQGFSFEAHSHSHPNLTRLSDAELTSELEESRKTIIQLTGNSAAFAYPYGEFDQRVSSATASRFEVAFSADPGLNWRGTDPLALRRSMPMRGDSRLDLWFLLHVGWSPLSRLRFRFRSFLDRRRQQANSNPASPASSRAGGA